MHGHSFRHEKACFDQQVVDGQGVKGSRQLLVGGCGAACHIYNQQTSTPDSRAKIDSPYATSDQSFAAPLPGGIQHYLAQITAVSDSP
jgi:hypothetical protein